MPSNPHAYIRSNSPDPRWIDFGGDPYTFGGLFMVLLGSLHSYWKCSIEYSGPCTARPRTKQKKFITDIRLYARHNITIRISDLNPFLATQFISLLSQFPSPLQIIFPSHTKHLQSSHQSHSSPTLRLPLNDRTSHFMGAQKSIHAGKAKIDVNVDFTHKLCAALMLSPFRNSGSPLSQVIGSLCIKHPNLFGGSEKLDVSWDKGLYDSNILVAYRRPRPEWLSQQSFVVQHSVSPDFGVHGFPIDNFSRSGSGGVNLCRFSAGVNLNEPASSHWSSTTSIKFEHVRPINDDGRSISRDLDGFPVTCSGSTHDSMVVLKQESRYSKANDRSFSQLSLQIEQGIPVLSKWLMFNRFKFCASKGVKLGPALFRASLTGGSIVGDMAPYQAFAIGGLGSVRGYGEGAVGTGRSCLIGNSDLTLPLSKMLEAAVFMDCGTDLGSGHHVPGNPGLRHGKPGIGIGLGYGIRLNSRMGQFQADYAINAFHQRTLYFGISNVVS